jgi:hypothetical protein
VLPGHGEGDQSDPLDRKGQWLRPNPKVVSLWGRSGIAMADLIAIHARLTKEQEKWLDEKARITGASKAQLIRSLISTAMLQENARGPYSASNA